MSADRTQEWAALTLRGFAAMSCTRSDDAARSWLDAVDLLKGATTDEPLLAASRANAGFAALILQQHAAARAFAEAEQSWLQVVASTAKLDIPMLGASSSFHFRLAAKAPEALRNASRLRYHRLAEAGLAITRFNHLFADVRNMASGAIAQSAGELKAILCESLGPGSAEVRLLSISPEASDVASAFSIYGDKAAEFTARGPKLSTALFEACAKLETAVALTALLGPRIFAAIGNDKTDPSRLRTRYSSSSYDD